MAGKKQLFGYRFLYRRDVVEGIFLGGGYPMRLSYLSNWTFSHCDSLLVSVISEAWPIFVKLRKFECSCICFQQICELKISSRPLHVQSAASLQLTL